MILTSSHNNWKCDKFPTYSISGNRGKDAGYVGKCYPKLAPKIGFWKEWHDNIGKISEEDNNRFYIREFYNQVLSKLNAYEVFEDLNDSILLCYEDSQDFCHRHIVSAWLELETGFKVFEAVANDLDIDYVLRSDDIKKYLKEYMSEINEEKVKKLVRK